MYAKLLCAVLAAILALTSCQSVPSNDNTTSLPVTSQEDSVVTTPDESAVTDTRFDACCGGVLSHLCREYLRRRI